MSAAARKAAAKSVLAYLERLPAYPFDAEIDGDFVRELVEDFVEIDLLEEIKSFRWFYCQKMPSTRSMRLSLRRWIANAKARRSRREPT